MASSVGRPPVDRVMLGSILRATIELGLARMRLGARHVQASFADSPAAETALNQHQKSLVDRIAYVTPRVAARLPWRADCLVQALAAQRWLTRNGVETTLKFGVPKNRPVTFEAHAWLTVSDRIVTGGDISGYVPLERP